MTKYIKRIGTKALKLDFNFHLVKVEMSLSKSCNLVATLERG